MQRWTTLITSRPAGSAPGPARFNAVINLLWMAREPPGTVPREKWQAGYHTYAVWLRNRCKLLMRRFLHLYRRPTGVA